MRVLVAGLRSVSEAEGGIESHARCLYPLIDKLGWDVEIIVRRPFHTKGTSDQFGNIKLVPIWSPTSRSAETLVHTLLATLYAIWSRPDIFHIHAIGPAVCTPLARLFGLTVVVTHHGPDYDREKWGSIGKWVLRLGECLGMRFANRRIVISQTIQKLIENKYQLNSDLIPNGVNPPQLAESTGLLSELGLEPGKYILQVSRLVPEKRQNDLIEGFQKAKLGDWRLLFVGKFSLKDSYSRDIRDLAEGDGRVVFAGFRTGQELNQLFQHAGLFVLPSSHEGLPIALLEALSFGLRVLASDIPANLEVELPKSSYFPLGDTTELANRLRLAAAEPESAQESDARRRWVLEQYSWGSIAQSTVKAYQDSLGLHVRGVG